MQGSRGALFEAHLRAILNDIGWNRGVTYPFLSGEISSSNFLFRPLHEGKSVEVLKKEPSESPRLFESYTEIDLFALVGELPVVFEAKIRRSAKFGKGGISRFLSEEYTDKKLRPLAELFGLNSFGFVIVTTKDRVTGSDAQMEFESRGGIMVGIPIEHSEFMKSVDNFKNSVTIF